MTKEQLNHMIEQVQAEIRHHRTMAELLDSSAAQQQVLLDAICSLEEENQQLREQLHTTHIENFNGTYIENNQSSESCRQSSTTSTEPTSSISTTTSVPHITPLLPTE